MVRGLSLRPNHKAWDVRRSIKKKKKILTESGEVVDELGVVVEHVVDGDFHRTNLCRESML
jgi:hypothetical protein